MRGGNLNLDYLSTNEGSYLNATSKSKFRPENNRLSSLFQDCKNLQNNFI